VLNRAALILRPKQPFLDWARELDDSGLVPDRDGEQTVYLIPSFDSEDEAWDILRHLYAELFESELWGWHTDPTDWPTNRTFAMFCEWFKVEFHSIIEDLCDDEIVNDEEA
jgi:hypothetical protein